MKKLRTELQPSFDSRRRGHYSLAVRHDGVLQIFFLEKELMFLSKYCSSYYAHHMGAEYRKAEDEWCKITNVADDVTVFRFSFFLEKGIDVFNLNIACHTDPIIWCPNIEKLTTKDAK